MTSLRPVLEMKVEKLEEQNEKLYKMLKELGGWMLRAGNSSRNASLIQASGEIDKFLREVCGE